MAEQENRIGNAFWYGPDLTQENYLTATQQRPMASGDELATGKKKKDDELLRLLMLLTLFKNPMTPMAGAGAPPTPTPMPSPSPTPKPLYRDNAIEQANRIQGSR